MTAGSPQPRPDAADDRDALLEVAVEAARRAGELLLRHYNAPAREVRTKSGPRDLVSAADLSAEKAIRNLLARARPGDGILGEEEGETPSTTGFRWVVDPLDGTSNFLRRVPHWSVSVACEDEAGAVVGVVHDPLRDEWFSAVRGRGCELNGQRLRGSSASDVALASVGGEFAVHTPGHAEPTRRLLSSVGHARSYGSAALDLAWAAAGRFDAVYHGRFPSPWDIAAGGILCSEAGLRGERITIHEVGEPALVVAPPELFEQLVAALTID